MTTLRGSSALLTASFLAAAALTAACPAPRNEQMTVDAAPAGPPPDGPSPPDASTASTDAAVPPPPDAGASPPPDAAADSSRLPDTAPPAPLDAAPPPPRPDAAPDLPPPEPPPTVDVVLASSAPVNLPGGTGVLCLPDAGRPPDTCPVLRWNGYVYWALSYDDNRPDLDVVAFNGNNAVVKEIAARGTRYIRRITVDVPGKTVTFLGQDEGTGRSPAVTLSWDDLRVAR